MTNTIPLLILISFIVFRNSFTLIVGKRDRKKVEWFIYFGRKIIEIFVSFIIPILVLLGLIESNTNIFLFYFGILLSILGLFFMVWTRINRGKDWGFMGDESGDIFFVSGPYRFTRHPYYIGSIFVGIGLYLQLNYILAILMIPTIIFISYVIKKEDYFLQGRFGESFVKYKSRVGIFPWFYKLK